MRRDDFQRARPRGRRPAERTAGRAPDREAIRSAIEPVVEEQGLELLRLDYGGSRGNTILRLMLDRTDGPVTLDDCSRVSGAVGRLLDGLDLIPWRYRLEVTSPGLDRPLLRPQDFERFQGSAVRIVLREPLLPESPQRQFVGRLASYDAEADALTIETPEGPLRIARPAIERARLEPEIPVPVRPGRGARP